MKTQRNALLAFTVFITVVTLRCTSTQPDLSGNSTQIGNGRVTGLIYQPDSTTPAGDAVVYVRKINTLADIMTAEINRSSDSTFTDGNGWFITDSLDTGFYIIEANDGKKNFVLIDSVHVNDTDSTLLPPATLKPAGAIKGTIRLSEGSDPRKVFVLAFGFDRFATTDTNGFFVFTNLPEGNYHLRIMPLFDNYSIVDTKHVPVTSADTFDLGFIDLPFTGIPMVRNAAISYDTLKQWVTLQWNRPAGGTANCFNIYRRTVDPATAIFTQLNTYPAIDTIFIDSLVTPNRTYEYRITGVDSITAGEGAKSTGVRIRIALYDITPGNIIVEYDTIRQTVTLQWSNPDTARVDGYNVYRRNVDRNEVFWTPFNARPITGTSFIDSTFVLCLLSDSTGLKELTYEYCVGALIHNMQEGIRSEGIPVRVNVKHQIPSNIRYTYDTLRQTVNLKWNRPDMTIVEGFTLFRKNSSRNDTILSQINSSMLQDTFCVDSTGLPNQIYEYRVAAVVKNSRAKVMSSGVNVQFTASFSVDTIFNLSGSGDGQFLYPNDIAVSGNGEIFIADQGYSRIQVYDSTMRYKKSVGVGILDYPLKVSVDDEGIIFVANYDFNHDYSSIYRFDSTGSLIDTVIDSMIINDIDVNNGQLYTLTENRVVSIYSVDGTLEKAWQVNSQNGSKWIAAGDSKRVFVSTGLAFPDRNNLIVFDSLGNRISTLTFPGYPFAIVFDSLCQFLYVVCNNSTVGNILHVIDKNEIEIARFKIQSNDQNISMGIHKNGTVYMVLKDEGKILTLKPLFQSCQKR
jgi:hypothetical protein